MAFFAKLFKTRKSAYDQHYAYTKEIDAAGFRQAAMERSWQLRLNDNEIIAVYHYVTSMFRAVAEQRNEVITVGSMNRIVLYFLFVKDKMGNEFFESQLDNELENFRFQGIRSCYLKELNMA